MQSVRSRLHDSRVTTSNHSYSSWLTPECSRFQKNTSQQEVSTWLPTPRPQPLPLQTFMSLEEEEEEIHPQLHQIDILMRYPLPGHQ